MAQSKGIQLEFDVPFPDLGFEGNLSLLPYCIHACVYDTPVACSHYSRVEQTHWFCTLYLVSRIVGVPLRSNVVLQPTTHCLINVIEWVCSKRGLIVSPFFFSTPNLNFTFSARVCPDAI